MNKGYKMLKAEQPIGIFDSGIGGLTVAWAIHQQLPQENLIYFGDTAHMPWGNQSATAIQHYATKISQTLLEQNCKVIVIACNTASAAAFEAVQELVGNKAILFNVIDPVITHLANNYQNQNIGLIGTKQTIKSQAYATRLNKQASSIKLNSLATPLLAPLIEEGLSNSNAAQEMISHYLNHPSLESISALILGCTHYPLIKQRVTEFFKDKVEVIDSAQLISSEIARELKLRNLRNSNDKVSKTFYVSHDSDFFNQTAQQFFPGDIKLQTYPLWD
jgi:glutamate racemase